MSSADTPAKGTFQRFKERVVDIAPGFMVAVMVGLSAQFIAEHFGAPAMLMALLFGIALHFLAEEGRCVTGIDYTAKVILRFGVALLGVRISVDLLVGLGLEIILLLVAGVAFTICFGLLGARLLGRGWRLGLLTGGAVAICGASAAMAIAAVLPKNQHSERNLIFTILSVTVLSTIAMIIYPVIFANFALSDREIGILLGGTIHDVAQVVGAGFSVSEEAGDTATLVKLIRVSMLAPVVIIFALAIRWSGEKTPGEAKRPPLIQGFVLAFIAFATLNSFGVIPPIATEALSETSRWALLISIAAVGMKTSLKRIMEVGGQAVVLIVGETIFIAVFILLGVLYLM